MDLRRWVFDFNHTCSDDRVLEEIIKTQVDRGIQRRDPKEIEEVFKRFADGETENQHIPVSKLRDALLALDIMLPKKASEKEFLDKLDTNGNGKLELNEFVEAILASCTPLEEWAKGWHLAQLLADCIPRLDDSDGQGKDNLRVLKGLNDAHLEQVVKGFAYGLEKMLKDERMRLQDAFKQMDESVEKKQPNMKFEVVPEMKCGTIEDFHNGLAARIGD